MTKPTTLDRRTLLRRAGLVLTALPLARFAAGCATDEASAPDAPGGDAPDAPSGDAPDGSDWASGGTAAMTDKASYPDPFTGALTSCAVVASTTEGPCTTESNLVREDVSEGWAGLPVRLALKVVDGACAPVAGADVKIWHTNHEGIYSGKTPNPGMCNDNNESYIATDFMRGVQTTDANGVVAFDTCFPGWYRGRAIHIHVQVTQGGTTYRVSQLFFPEDITRAIFTSHPDYASYGQPDTTFANDNVLGPIAGAARTALVLDVARMSDGAMLASKVVAVVA